MYIKISVLISRIESSRLSIIQYLNSTAVKNGIFGIFMGKSVFCKYKNDRELYN